MTEVVVCNKKVEEDEHHVGWWYKRGKEPYFLASIGGNSVLLLDIDGEPVAEEVQVDNPYAITAGEFDAICGYSSSDFTKIDRVTINIE